MARRITVQRMDAAAAALSRLADTRGDRTEAVTALQAMNHGTSFAASTAGMQLNVLAPYAPLASDEGLRRFAAEWSEMARRSR